MFTHMFFVLRTGLVEPRGRRAGLRSRQTRRTPGSLRHAGPGEAGPSWAGMPGCAWPGKAELGQAGLDSRPAWSGAASPGPARPSAGSQQLRAADAVGLIKHDNFWNV